MENSKKRRIILAIMLVAIISVGVIGTYAYFLTSAGRNEEQKLTIKTGTLSLTFEDNDEGLTDQIMLGESRSKEFRIRNTGTEQVTTNMLWSGLVNTYLEESLSYTLEYKTSEDGTWQTVSTVSHTNIPQSERTSDYNLATGLTIPSGATYYYKLTITFKNLPDVNQEADKTAILSTKFKLGDMVVEASSEKTLAHLKLTAKTNNPAFTNIATTNETANGLYSLEDDYGTSYYYRGAVENNYVKFGGFYWRIIRINGDGSIRMQYDGTQAWPNGYNNPSLRITDRYSHNGYFNEKYNDNKYVGWVHGNSKNDESSTLKESVEAWYKTNIEDKGLSKFIGDEIFCGDRSLYSGTGIGTNYTQYGAYGRFVVTNATNKPSLKCSQKNDAYTVKDIKKGNGALLYPIGLITVDEVIAAGGKYLTNNTEYYLYKNNNYTQTWTLSPYYFSNSASYAFIVGAAGEIASDKVNYSKAAAVVINISPEYATTLIGTGTMTDPYQIPGVE